MPWNVSREHLSESKLWLIVEKACCPSRAVMEAKALVIPRCRLVGTTPNYPYHPDRRSTWMERVEFLLFNPKTA
jgi:hypothetical protein